MPAHPFQPFPTFKQFCDWLVESGGTIEAGENEWGTFTLLISPDKKRVVEPRTKPEDTLGPSSLDRLETRLGVESPWHPRFDESQE